MGRKKGGTLIAGTKSMLQDVFDAPTEAAYRKLSESCRKRKVRLETARGSISISGPRLVLMFLSGEEISRTEQKLLNAGTDPAVEEVLLLVWDEDSALDWIRKHNPELIGVAPNGWEEKLAA